MVQDPLIDCQLANYRIERLIGRGGMAQVYYGWDVKLERPVAIKVIDTRYRSNRAYAERFVREAQAVAPWRHENITQVYYAGEQDGLYYYAMEFVDGLDLASLLSQYAAEGELMPQDDVLRIGRSIANALDYAHEKGVIHRDVKPSNVLVSGDGRVVLTDFGLAMDISQGSMGEVFGSAHYIAPEQARHSADAVPQSDQYALGTILYEMLTGVVPFDDPSPTSVALQHILSPLPSPQQINPDLNPETAALLHKALDKDPNRRYPNCSTLLEALGTALQTGITTPPTAELPLPPAGTGPVTDRTISRTSVNERVARHLAAAAPVPERERADQKICPPPPDTPTPADRLVGRQLDEYRIDTLLGQGGMARTYRGLDVQLGRYVAIKVIDTPFRSDSEYVRRFEREVQAIAQLEHPHIVRLYRYGQTSGLLYIAMQYIGGQDLRSILADYRSRGTCMPIEQILQIIQDVCLALDQAHSRGVIHRDVKPSNIMVDPQGRAILTDFGLALLAQAETQGGVLGYTAPEQAISSAGIVSQSDLYAVGVILYEMLTNNHPFEAEDSLDLALLHMTKPPLSPREWRPEIGPQLEAVVLKALAKQPQDRYQSGAALAAAVEQACRAPAGEDPFAALPRALGQRKLPSTVLEQVVDGEKPAEPALPPLGLDFASGQVVPIEPVQPFPPAGETDSAAEKAPLPPIPAAVAVGPQPSAARPDQAHPTAAAPARPGRGRPRLWVGAGMALMLILAAASLLNWKGLFLPGAFWNHPTPTVTSRPTTVPRPTARPSAHPSPLPTRPASTTVPIVAASRPPATTLPPSPTLQPTATPQPTSRPTSPVPQPGPFALLLARRGEESLFLRNESDSALPLEPLRLGSGPTAIQGQDWALPYLESGACTAAWRDTGSPRPPEALEDCELVGEHLARGGREIVWKNALPIYYTGVRVGTCFEGKEDTCTIEIPAQLPANTLFFPLAGKGK